MSIDLDDQYFEQLIQSAKTDEMGPAVAILKGFQRLLLRVNELQYGVEQEGKQIRDEISRLTDALNER